MNDTIYALSGRGRTIFAARESGLQRSTDGGRTWQPAFASLNASEPIPAYAVTLSPQFDLDKTVFVAVAGGILRSTNNGDTWQMAQMPEPKPFITALACSLNYAQDKTVFAASLEDGVLLTNDGGANWHSWNFGLLDAQVLSLAVAKDGLLFAGTSSGLFLSQNNGKTFREILLPCGHVPVSGVASNSKMILAGTEESGLWTSGDLGLQWQQVGENEFETINALIVSEKAILALTEQGVEISNDQGESWQTQAIQEIPAPVMVCNLEELRRKAKIAVANEQGEIIVLKIR